MYFYFLVEDSSGKVLVDLLMKKIQSKYRDIDIYYDIKAFKGLGGFTKKNTVKETKTGKLLNDLTTFLKGFNKSLGGLSYNATVVIVVDNDNRNTEDFRRTLDEIVDRNSITIDHVFAIAVEEMEAWLIGDINAVLTAYPNAKRHVLDEYIQDSICGTWETLANAIYRGGLAKMRKECPSYMDIGRVKAEWAKKIGTYIDIENNNSPSFKMFMEEVQRRCVNM